jgi:hypothetical protein
MNEEILTKLADVNTEEEFFQIMAENDIGPEEAAAFIEYLRNTPEELGEDDLDNVAGGAVPLHQALSRFAYRIKHGKLFVKSTVDTESRTITVTNRFGKKVTETYIY